MPWLTHMKPSGISSFKNEKAEVVAECFDQLRSQSVTHGFIRKWQCFLCPRTSAAGAYSQLFFIPACCVVVSVVED